MMNKEQLDGITINKRCDADGNTVIRIDIGSESWDEFTTIAEAIKQFPDGVRDVQAHYAHEEGTQPAVWVSITFHGTHPNANRIIQYLLE